MVIIKLLIHLGLFVECLLCLKISKDNGNVSLMKYVTVPLYKSYARRLVLLKSRPVCMPGNDVAWIMCRKLIKIKKSISKIISEITRSFKYVNFHFIIPIAIFGLLCNRVQYVLFLINLQSF